MVKKFSLLFVFVLMLIPFSTHAQDTNLTEGCVENYDESVDYFPEKISVDIAQGFEVDYFNHYKVVRVLSPWVGATEPFEYVLVQCGTPIPEGFDETIQVIEVPVQRAAALSTTYLPHFVELGVIDRLVGIDSYSVMSTNTPEVQERFAADALVDLGQGANINIEITLDLDPDLVIAYASGLPEYDSHPILLDAGIHVALNAEYLEYEPLGQAEWIKFTALFFNQESAANAYFDELVTRYNDLLTLTAAIPDDEKPTVFAGVPFDGDWFVPGGQSYVAQFFEDAGAKYLWADEESTGGVPLDFEVVLERAANADFWLNTGFWSSLEAALAEDERFAEFGAFQNGSVYNNNARENENLGNDYYESGVIHPDLVLGDMIAIFHPELLPDHELYYYRQLD